LRIVAFPPQGSEVPAPKSSRKYWNVELLEYWNVDDMDDWIVDGLVKSPQSGRCERSPAPNGVQGEVTWQ
jgi:hypothetical protein